MTEKDKQLIITLEKIYENISEFSCNLCKIELNISTYEGCPIYCQTFDFK